MPRRRRQISLLSVSGAPQSSWAPSKVAEAIERGIGSGQQIANGGIKDRRDCQNHEAIALDEFLSEQELVAADVLEAGALR